MIVTERWYSPDLQMVVMTKRSDPRSGDTVFQMTSIARTEPAATFVPGAGGLHGGAVHPRVAARFAEGRGRRLRRKNSRDLDSLKFARSPLAQPQLAGGKFPP